MRTKTLQAVAVALGLGACTVAHAENPYEAPSKWTNFRTVADTVENVPAPTAKLPAPPAANSVQSSPAESAVGSGSTYASPYSEALSTPWTGATPAPCANGSCGTSVRPALSPWFGSANLLFYTLERGHGGSMISGDIYGGAIRSGRVDPEASVGFDVGAGRYFGCGQYGLGVTYMLWNPSSESIIENRDLAGVPIAAGGGLRADNIGYNDVNINIGGAGADTLYQVINGAGGIYAGATGIRLTRDMMFQGIEANLYGFGLMGARRAAYIDCNPCNKGYGGMAGPLVRAKGGRVRVMTSHGFRWFQVQDEFEAAFNIDGAAGYAATDLYDNVDVENNLYGYQFGGMLNYCLSCRWNMNIGGKFGIYGNHVDYRHRQGTRNELAYITAAGTDDISVSSSDTVLAGMGELDLGLGFRINNAWSIRGGYRMLAICGVADGVENMQNTDYTDISSVSNFEADDCLILHGGYVGLTFNW